LPLSGKENLTRELQFTKLQDKSKVVSPFSQMEKITASQWKAMGNSTLCISGVVFWEIYKLIQFGRIELQWDQKFLHFMRSFVILPLDASVFLSLFQRDFRLDPIDEIITATSFTHSVPLLTRNTIFRSKGYPTCFLNFSQDRRRTPK